jgi:1-carboxybiuret hydrolase
MKASATAAEIAAAVRTGATTARAVTEAALARIAGHNARLGAFTDVTAGRALAKADAVDALIASGKDAGPLAGVPFAAKNLYDIAGVVTRAGSKINRENAPATSDATLITKMETAGAILLGGLNMGEYAYDFTGENAHDGNSRNPHDLTRMSGGSSGGSGTAAAAGLVPITLGSDTNGSIRVPSSLCGLFGLKPTNGRLSRGGTFPFVSSLDHLGPLGRSTADLALAYDAMQGTDPRDPMQADRPIELTTGALVGSAAGLKVAVADGYFAQGEAPRTHVKVVADALGATDKITLPFTAEARAAAYLITMIEGATLHLDRLRTRPDDFDPDVRDRLIAGAMLPGVWVQQGQKVRRFYREAVLRLFETYDVILAPSTPMTAPLSGQRTMIFEGEEMLVRPNLGLFTQPISFIGLPVVSVPVWLPGALLPLGVQIIAAPWREDVALRLAHHLEQGGVVAAPVAKEFADD